MLTLCREALGLDGHLPTLPGACGSPSTSWGPPHYSLHPTTPGPCALATTPGPCVLATPLRALCSCFLGAVHPVEHPQERPEGVRVRPARRRHGPLRAVRLQRLQAGPGAPGPTLRFRLGGQLHADVFCHGGCHLQGTWGPGGWQGGSSPEAWVWLSSSPRPCLCPCPVAMETPLAWDGQHLGIPAAGWLGGNRGDGNEGGLPVLLSAHLSLPLDE